MPKIISYTPGWLSRPSPGFQTFNTANSTSSSASKGSSQRCSEDLGNGDYAGQNRTLAQRGTEVYLAVGKQIRWTDLVSLKEEYEEQLQTPSRKPRSTSDADQRREEVDGPEDGSYRVY